MSNKNCTYTFTNGQGQKQTIMGMSSMKAFLVDGGLDLFYPSGRFPWLSTESAIDIIQPGPVERRPQRIGSSRYSRVSVIPGINTQADANAQDKVVAYMNGDISRTTLLDYLSASGLPQEKIIAFTQRMQDDAPSLGEIKAMLDKRNDLDALFDDVLAEEMAKDEATESAIDLIPSSQPQAITMDQAGNMRAGDVVVDGQGNEFMALHARHKWIEVAPIVDGKPQVSADTTIKFHLEPETKHLYRQERRGDPIYATGRNLYSQEATAAEASQTSNQMAGLIAIAADSIESLRRSDVDRVITEAPAELKQQLAEHIKAKRPDLAGEVDEVMAEMSKSAPQDDKKYHASRFEIGRSLTKEQRQEVLSSLTDVYKEKGADRELKGLDQNGNERYGYVYSPELFEKSDITGAMVRHYVTLPDGRKAHPTELFPDYTQSDIDAEMRRRENEEAAAQDRREGRLQTLRSRMADTLGEANRIFNTQNPGLRDYTPAILTNGQQFIRTAPESADGDAKLLGDGWAIQQESQAAEYPKLTKDEAAKLMEWLSLGQKDGVKTHILTFYSSQADKDAKRGRMIMATVTQGDRSSDKWTVDGDDQAFTYLAAAKKRGMEVGMAKAVQDGFVEAASSTAGTMENSRDAFTLQRMNDATGQMEPVTFRRREMVKIAAGQPPYQTGVITGISQADRKFKVDGLDLAHDFGYAYKADFDETARPRAEIDVGLDNLERRLNDGIAIQADGFIRTARETIERNALGDYAKERIAQLEKKAAEVSGNALEKMRAATAEREAKDAKERTEAQAKASEPKPAIDMTMDEWKAISKDFKGTIDGHRMVMRDGGMRPVNIVKPAAMAADKPASITPATDAHVALMDAVREGRATTEQFKAGFDAFVAGKSAILTELDAKTKVQLLREGGPYMQMRYASEKKADVVDAVYRQMLGEYALGESVTYGMGKDSYLNAVRKIVEATDADKLARYVQERNAALEEMKARREAKAAAMQNPQTLEDYREVIKSRVQEGMTTKEAFLSLTPEQRIKFDTLAAESTRDARESRKRAMKTRVSAASQTTGGQIIATKHTRDGYDLFVVQLADRLSAEDYKTVLSSAKKLGGWYSSFRGNGATPGFQFKDRASADAFLALAGGDKAAAQNQVEQRRDAFEDDRGQTAVERLRAMADKLEEQANEEEGRDRKANTARRARFASAALAAAAAEKAKAKTMRNIAQAIEDGKAKFLDEVRTKSQVDMLASIVETAKANELRAKYPSYADQEKRKGEPPTDETADFADFPNYSAFRSDLAILGRQLLEVDGTKKLGQRLMAVADDVTDAYLEFAKGNLSKVSQFGRGDALADFGNQQEAERAIKRSGLTGKAIVLQVKRGQNRVILSPSEAIGRGIWAGDGDKRITLTAEFGGELVEAIGRRGNKSNRLTVPWQFQNAYDRQKALSRIGIETASEFRSALREFIDLKEQATANRVRELELQMVGRQKDGLDFFPTAAEVADQMVEAADLSPDMAVLEPSAGMGHLADRIREAGAEPDVIELSPDRRELLEEKGYHLAEVNDFMAMEPRKFFTYGDVFRAPDGTEGIMRGVGGMGSQRVRLEDEAGNRLGLYDKSDLVGVRHRGVWSGYDRIIMNPPFSNRRDAEHVRHAYDLLKPGGRIVAIMGEGVFFGQDQRAVDFRDWLDSVGGTSEKLPEGSFMDPSLPVNTGVNARMVVIDKPANETPAFSRGSASTDAGVNWQPAVDQSAAKIVAAGMRAAEKNKPGNYDYTIVEPARASSGFGNRGQAGAQDLTDALSRRIRDFEAAFGRRVVFVRADNGSPDFFNGFILPKSDPDTIYVNASADVNLLSILGHEFYEGLVVKNPDLHEWFAEEALKQIKSGALASYATKLAATGDKQNLDGRFKELLADFTGDALADPEFRRSLARSNPGKFQALIRSFRDFMIRLLGQMRSRAASKGIMGERTLQSSQYFKDVQALRDVLRDVIRQSDTGGNLQQALANGGILFSRSGVDTPWRARWSEQRIDDILGRFAYPADPSRTRAYAATISPVDFLDATTPAVDRAQLEAEAFDLDAERLAGERQPIFLEVKPDESDDGVYHIVGHEGRHRMVALLNAGIDSVPVAIVMRGEAVEDAQIVDEPYFKPQVFKADGTRARRGFEVREMTPISYAFADEIRDSYGRPPADDAVMFSRRAVHPLSSKPGAWEAPADTYFDRRVIYALQDKLIDTKRVQAAITKTAGEIEDELNAYQREELYHGRAAKRAQDFLTQELNPMVEKLAKDGIELADFEEYLHARHAPEANRVLAERNPNQAMIDAGLEAATLEIEAVELELANTTDPTEIKVLSRRMREAQADLSKWSSVQAFRGPEEDRLRLSGMSDDQARAIMDALTPEQRAKLDAAAAQFDAIVAQNRQLMVDYDLEDQETIDSWSQLFQHYVPLMREDEGDGVQQGMGTGQGFSIKGREVKSRTGSTRKVVDIVANVAMQRERIITRGEKNRVSQALMGLAALNPNPDFWKLGAPDKKRQYDPATNTVKVVTDPQYKNRENVVVAKVRNSKGRVTEVALTFDKRDARAVRMAAAIKNLEDGQLNWALGNMAKITRYLASINTQYNPIFGVVNVIRDLQGAAVNLAGTPLKDSKTRIIRNAIVAIGSIYRGARKERKGSEHDSDWGKLWKEFQEVGGMTGFRDQFRNSGDRARAIERTMNPEQWMESAFGKVVTAGGLLKKPMTWVQDGAGWVLDLLSDYNLAMENGVRLAAYKEGLSKGLTREQAASLAKNITVNFNRRGSIGLHVGSAYAFFNAAMQGTARLGQALTTMEDGKLSTLRLSDLGKKVVAGGVMMGVAQAAALAMAGFGDDEPPQFVREKNLIIPTGWSGIGSEKGYLTIPMPLGLHVIPGLGRHLTEFAMSGGKNPAERVTMILGMFLDAFNPIGNAGRSLQTIAPTVLDPLAALAENKDFTGRNIAMERRNPNVPGHTLARDTASTFSKLLSEAINTLTGGNEYVSGVMSPTPDQIDYLVGQVTGGVGRELMKVEQTVRGAMTGEEVPLHKIPLVGRFVGDSSGSAGQSNIFRANVNRLDRAQMEIDGLRKDGKFQESNALRERSNPYLLAQARAAESQVQRLRRMKHDLVKKGADRDSVREVERKISEAMTRLNRAVESQAQ